MVCLLYWKASIDLSLLLICCIKIFALTLELTTSSQLIYFLLGKALWRSFLMVFDVTDNLLVLLLWIRRNRQLLCKPLLIDLCLLSWQVLCDVDEVSWSWSYLYFLINILKFNDPLTLTFDGLSFPLLDGSAWGDPWSITSHI